MFGIKLPGFLNPLTPFKNAFAVVGTAVENAKDVASVPGKIVGHQVGFAKDVLTLNFKGAAEHQLGLATLPLQTAKEVAGNDVGLVQKLFKNFF